LIQDYGVIEAPAPQLVLGRADHERVAATSDMSLAQSCGKPLRPSEFAIRRLRRRARIGVITLAGPSLMSGYLTQTGVDESALGDGSFATGDLASQASDGYVTLVGRTTNIVATGGRKVSVESVEQALSACAGVMSVAVTGVADERWGEMLVALVVLEPGGSTAGVAAFARRNLVSHERPKAIFAVSNLPIGPTGKLRREELGRLALRLGHGSENLS
jgi:acyl-CoA synthetase (AMP-forming)/AMP-acid ligase II